MNTNIYFLSYLARFFLGGEIFQTKVVLESQNTPFMLSNFFPLRKSFSTWDNVEKCSTAGQATDKNMTHAHCVLDT